MKLADQTIDPIKLEEGDWVENIPEWGDLRLKVKGIRNKAWVRMQRILMDAVPKKMKIGGRIDETEQDKITTSLLLNTCLLDWSGLEDDVTPIPYSKEKASELLNNPRHRNFRDAVIWAATVVAEQGAVVVEDAAKN